jgi:hypothetical protein
VRLQTLGIVLGLALALAAASAAAQSIDFLPTKEAVLCKYEAGRRPPGPAPLKQFPVPVYAAAPDRDFYVIGEVRMWGRPGDDIKDPRNWAIKQLAIEARAHGADGILIVTPFEGRYCQALVIRWSK